MTTFLIRSHLYLYKQYLDDTVSKILLVQKIVDIKDKIS